MTDRGVGPGRGLAPPPPPRPPIRPTLEVRQCRSSSTAATAGTASSDSSHGTPTPPPAPRAAVTPARFPQAPASAAWVVESPQARPPRAPTYRSRGAGSSAGEPRRVHREVEFRQRLEAKAVSGLRVPGGPDLPTGKGSGDSSSASSG